MESTSEIYFLIETDEFTVEAYGTLEHCKDVLKCAGAQGFIYAADQYVIAKMVPLRYNEKGEIIEEI